MDIAERLLSVLVPIFFVVFVGFVYAKNRNSVRLDTANKLNLEVFTPFLVFSALSQKQFDLSVYLPFTICAIVIVILPGIFSIPLARRLGLHWKTFLPPMMFRNSGNIGLPLFLLAFGEEALVLAIILFVVENTLHFSLGMRMLQPQAKLRALLAIPILQATIIGLVFSMFEWRLPAPIADGVEFIGQISIPLMLFSLGARMASTQLSAWKVGLISGIWAPLIGLVVAALCLTILGGFVHLPKEQISMLIVFSMLPPAVLNFLIAEQLNQEPDKVASIVLTGNLCAVFTLPFALLFAFTN